MGPCFRRDDERETPRTVRCRSCESRGGGFTLEVQHFAESLGGGFEVKAFSWSVVIDGDEMTEAAVRECGEIGLAGNKAAHPSNGRFQYRPFATARTGR